MKHKTEKQRRIRVAVQSRIEERAKLCSLPGDPCQPTVKKVKNSGDEHQEAAEKKMAGGEQEGYAHIQHEAQYG
jgi:hypothetical protein